jgi:hypothetical protein
MFDGKASPCRNGGRDQVRTDAARSSLAATTAAPPSDRAIAALEPTPTVLIEERPFTNATS